MVVNSRECVDVSRCGIDWQLSVLSATFRTVATFMDVHFEHGNICPTQPVPQSCRLEKALIGSGGLVVVLWDEGEDILSQEACVQP